MQLLKTHHYIQRNERSAGKYMTYIKTPPKWQPKTKQIFTEDTLRALILKMPKKKLSAGIVF